MSYSTHNFGPPDLASEPLVDLNYARRHLIPKKDGKPISPSTMQRWISKGVDGVRLAVVYVGRKPHTSEAAIQRFYQEMTAKRAAALAATEAVIAASESDLIRAGLLRPRFPRSSR